MADGQKEHEQAKEEPETLKGMRRLSHIRRYGYAGNEHADIEQPPLPGQSAPVSPSVGPGRIPILSLSGHA
jgi:hypothetical protein